LPDRSSTSIAPYSTLKSKDCKDAVKHRKFNEETDKTVVELPDKHKLDLGRETYSVPEMHFLENVLHF
jgi:hypothetical protein